MYIDMRSGPGANGAATALLAGQVKISETPAKQPVNCVARPGLSDMDLRNLAEFRVKLKRFARETEWTGHGELLYYRDSDGSVSPGLNPDGSATLYNFTCPLCDNSETNGRGMAGAVVQVWHNRDWEDGAVLDRTSWALRCHNCSEDPAIRVVGYVWAVAELVGWQRRRAA